MSPLVPLAMFGWIPVVLLLFSQLPPRRAVVAAFVGAWLFLPVARYEFSGLPEYTKMSATCLGIMLGATVFDGERLFAFRPRAVDAPMALWCLAPLLSSLSNGLGLYDGVSASVNQTTVWGLPYFIGRVYLVTPRDFLTLAKAVFAGGLVYIPFCLWESRMSPQLHRMLYGFYAHPDFSQTMRLGGYRPMVFMEHGLMVGMWMTSASLTGVWLWTSGALRGLFGAPMRLLVPALLGATVMVRSMGALMLLTMGLTALFVSRRRAAAGLILLLLLAPPAYMGLRATGAWSGDTLVQTLALASEDRAESLGFRFYNENILAEKAMLRPAFGWGGWGRARVYNEMGEDISTTDGLWIIVLGNYGLFGLFAMLGVFVLPTARFFLRHGEDAFARPGLAPGTAMGVLLALYMVDGLLNAMINPMFILTAGGMTSLAMTPDTGLEAARSGDAEAGAYTMRYL